MEESAKSASTESVKSRSSLAHSLRLIQMKHNIIVQKRTNNSKFYTSGEPTPSARVRFEAKSLARFGEPHSAICLGILEIWIFHQAHTPTLHFTCFYFTLATRKRSTPQKIEEFLFCKKQRFINQIFPSLEYLHFCLVCAVFCVLVFTLKCLLRSSDDLVHRSRCAHSPSHKSGEQQNVASEKVIKLGVKHVIRVWFINGNN